MRPNLTTSLFCIASLFCAVSCATSGDSAGDKGANGGSGESEVEAAQTEPRQVEQEAASALASCRRDIEAIEQVPRNGRVAFAVEACSGLWLRDACSNSFASSLDQASYLRAGTILRSCRDAYCPTFEPAVRDALALCQAPLDDAVSLVRPLADDAETDPLDAWRAFNDVIFAETFGATSDQQLAGDFPSMLLQLVVVAPPSEP